MLQMMPSRNSPAPGVKLVVPLQSHPPSLPQIRLYPRRPLGGTVPPAMSTLPAPTNTQHTVYNTVRFPCPYCLLAAATQDGVWRAGRERGIPSSSSSSLPSRCSTLERSAILFSLPLWRHPSAGEELPGLPRVAQPTGGASRCCSAGQER